jgi:hypothetical protein
VSPLARALERLEAEVAYSEQIAASSRSDAFAAGRAAGIRYAINLVVAATQERVK